jgi:acyl dehydratase
MTTEADPTFKPEAIGQPGDPVSFGVERERIAAYAAATNDTIPAHAAGDLAPPVFAIVPAFQAAGMASLRVIPGEMLGAILPGEQDFHFSRPIEPGMKLGELLVEQFMTTFVRGAQGAADVGEEAPAHGFDESLRERAPDAVVSQTFDADQTFRYAESSGDPMQIHLDDEFAKSVGLPGIIIHGLCTMAFTSVAAIEHACPDDPTRLKRLAVRFASIALPEQTITTRIGYVGNREGRRTYAFETANDAGAVVIKDGLAEVAPA